jgi:hypothetical protein
MTKLAAPLTVLALCYVFFFSYVALSYPSLPARLASHFDLQGRPNGWMSRDTCVAFMLGFGVLVPAILVGTMAGSGRIPVSFVNLPHRDYWLDPVRRQATLALLRLYGIWLASLTVLFFTGLHWLIVQANRDPKAPHLSGHGLLFITAIFLAATGVWIARLLRHFSKID